MNKRLIGSFFAIMLACGGDSVLAADDAGRSGKELYERYCASCHGKAGRDDGPGSRRSKYPESPQTDCLRALRFHRDAASEDVTSHRHGSEVAHERAFIDRVLVLGRPPDVLQDVMEQLAASGVSVQASTDAQYAADLFDARDFDLISFRQCRVRVLE